MRFFLLLTCLVVGLMAGAAPVAANDQSRSEAPSSTSQAGCPSVSGCPETNFGLILLYLQQTRTLKTGQVTSRSAGSVEDLLEDCEAVAAGPSPTSTTPSSTTIRMGICIGFIDSVLQGWQRYNAGICLPATFRDGDAIVTFVLWGRSRPQSLQDATLGILDALHEKYPCKNGRASRSRMSDAGGGSALPRRGGDARRRDDGKAEHRHGRAGWPHTRRAPGPTGSGGLDIPKGHVRDGGGHRHAQEHQPSQPDRAGV